MPDGGRPARRVTVVGGGVIGLTCALELARVGHQVRVLTADPVEGTTSAVAAALWFPYHAAPVDAVLRWAATTLGVLTRLAADPATGVALLPGTVVSRAHEPDLWWASAVPEVADMGRYLAWLLAECQAAGVVVEPTRIDRLPDVPGDVVVVAAGLASGPLLGDDSGVPVQGQVVRLTDPGLDGWLLDEDNPAGLTYVVPRGGDVVCGGTAVAGATTGTEPDPAVEAAVLARVHALVPALRGAAVLSRAVGLRPGRPTVRLEHLDVDGRPVIACYGHGGGRHAGLGLRRGRRGAGALSSAALGRLTAWAAASRPT